MNICDACNANLRSGGNNYCIAQEALYGICL